MKGKFDITKCIHNDSSRTIRIKIYDDISRIMIVEAEIDLMTFADAITGLAYQECEINKLISKDKLHNIGKKLERGSFVIKLPTYPTPSHEQIVKVVNEDLGGILAEGWQLYDDGIGRRQDGSHWVVILEKYEDVT